MSVGLEEKLRIAESFMKTARFLDATVGKVVIAKSEEAVKARINEQRYQGKTVCHFLYAVVFELAIKIIWAIDKGEDCRPTHNIFSLYKEHSLDKQSQIKDLYDEQVSVLKRNLEGRKEDGSSFRAENLADFRSLEEALKSNKDTMTNFKYDGKFRGKNSCIISGVIWNSEEILVLPARFVIFPIRLLAYAKESLEHYSASTN